MDHRKNKHRKILPGILILLCLLLFSGALVLGVRAQVPETIENPVQGISADSSMKGYLGKGYTYADLDTDSLQTESTGTLAQVPENEPEEQQEEADPEEEPEVTAPSDDTVQAASEETEESVEDGNTDQENPSEEPQQPAENTVQYDPEDGEDNQEDQEATPDLDDDRNQEGAEVPEEETPTPAPEENKYPSVATDLTDGETVSASYRTFYVQAWDYQGNVLPSSSVEVLGNGQKLYSVSTDGEGIIAYRMELTETENTVDIKVTDSEGWSYTLPQYRIIRSEDGEEQPAGTVNISIEAGSVGLGTILSSTPAEFYQGEQLSSVVLRLLQNTGFDWRNNGSATGGFYLKAIGRGGIAAGAAIPDDLMEHLKKVNCQLSSHDANWIGEFDFTMNSGWMYFVNGEYMNVGMSSCFPGDGDEVRLRFTLYSGADLGVGSDGEVWGDW